MFCFFVPSLTLALLSFLVFHFLCTTQFRSIFFPRKATKNLCVELKTPPTTVLIMILHCCCAGGVLHLLSVEFRSRSYAHVAGCKRMSRWLNLFMIKNSPFLNWQLCGSHRRKRGEKKTIHIDGSTLNSTRLQLLLLASQRQPV